MTRREIRRRRANADLAMFIFGVAIPLGSLLGYLIAIHY